MSNLPTVWSDCLAAWCLGGQGSAPALAGAALSASFLYEGGMFLNDAFDAEFDRHHRRSRPIPSGAISERTVWQWGFGWLALGLTSAIWLGLPSLLWAAILCACILCYNAVHKWTPAGPLLMGACRLCVYLLAASAARRGVSGEVVWKGLGLAAYIAGLSCLARKESQRGRVNFWPSLLLAAPVVCAGLFDDDPNWMPAVVYSLALAAWISWALSQSVGQEEPNVGYTVSRLLAGVVLVDLLAVASGGEPWIGWFAGWFVLALFLQRFIPAT
ncbi:MAG TPA: UbiA family prenyltransferase [Verrucomicrobiae bacterium]